MKASRSREAAERAVTARNAQAAKVKRMQDRLYVAEMRLEELEAKAHAQLPEDVGIRYSSRGWEVVS